MFMHINCVSLQYVYMQKQPKVFLLYVISYVTFFFWVYYYKVNIGPIYPLELMFTKVAWNIINPAFS